MENLESRIGFKVVTSDLKSLGLRGNPNILQYSIGEWISLGKEKIVSGSGDYGGIWVAKNLSGAKKLKKYMKYKYGKDVRIFKSYISDIIYSNSYRVKTSGIKMFQEIK